MIKKIVGVILLMSVLVVIPVEGATRFVQKKKPAQSAKTTDAKELIFYEVHSFPLKYADALSLGVTLRDLVEEGERIAINEKLNTVVIRSQGQNVERFAAVIKEMDQPPLQLMVEAKIIELKSGSGDTTDPSSLGFSWKYTENPDDYVELNTTGTVSPGAQSLGLYAQLISGNVEAYLNALEKTVGYNLIASPWVSALNHEQAEILIGSKYGYKTTIITDTSTVQQVEFLQVGTNLTFTPHINEDGYIIMDIYPSISEGSVVNDLPQENTTETKNKVLVKDGQPIVIGGLTKEYDQEIEIGIPIISHIPLLGNLFKRTEIQSEKRDIMIIITPHIVTAQFLEQMQRKAMAFEESRRQAAEKAKLIR
jgi:type II secretory pathway component GspD/PulD (secretin)